MHFTVHGSRRGGECRSGTSAVRRSDQSGVPVKLLALCGLAGLGLRVWNRAVEVVPGIERADNKVCFEISLGAAKQAGIEQEIDRFQL